MNPAPTQAYHCERHHDSSPNRCSVSSRAWDSLSTPPSHINAAFLEPRREWDPNLCSSPPLLFDLPFLQQLVRGMYYMAIDVESFSSANGPGQMENALNHLYQRSLCSRQLVSKNFSV